jgi:hypothetical protein
MRSRARAIIAAVAAWVLAAAPCAAQVSKSTMATNIATTFPDQTVGAITPSAVRAFMTTLVNSYQQYEGIRNVTGVTDTIGVGDYGQLVLYNNAGAIAVTLPQANGALSTFNFFMRNLGVGAVTITPQVSTINGASNLVVTTNQSYQIVSDGTNWQIGIGPPTLNPLNVTRLVAGDGCTTDRSGGSQIWTCRVLSTNGNTHDFSVSDTINYTASGLGHASYDDQTICTGTSGAINPNHCYSYQSFISWSGAGTMAVMGFANFSPALTAGAVTQLVFANCQDVSLSGGATVANYNCYNCPALTASTSSRCIFTAAQTPVEMRGHWITHVIPPTLTACGTNPAVAGSDTAGEVTMGTGTPTGCVISFTPGTYGAYNAAPFCTVTWQGDPLATQHYTVSTAAITITQTATSSNKVNYTCIARNGG